MDTGTVSLTVESGGQFQVIRSGDAKGCGYWLPTDGSSLAEAIRSGGPEGIAEWFECAIPDEEHHGVDHVLTVRRRPALDHR